MSGVRLLLDTAETVGAPRAGARRFWTGREELILRNTYPRAGLRACLEKLPGRTAKSIYQRAGALGLRSAQEAARGTPRQHYQSNEATDALIRRTYQNKPASGAIKALARTLNRPCGWIRNQAIRLGIAVPRFKPAPWVAAESAIIAENAHLGPAALQQRLKKAGFARSETAIVVKLKRLGVTTADPDHYTAHGLASLFGVDAGTVGRWIDRGWLAAQRRGTARLEQQGGDQWWIHRSNVSAFVADNAAVVDFRKVDKTWLVELLTTAVAPASVPASVRDGPLAPLALNPDRQQITAGARTVRLTRLEYALLEILVAHEARVVTQAMLMSRLYKGADQPDSAIIRVVVCRLRKKLLDAGANYMVAAVHGRGYVLRAPPEGTPAVN